MIFKICDKCGAYLDAGEVCDCTYNENDNAAESTAKEKHPEMQNRVSFIRK